MNEKGKAFLLILLALTVISFFLISCDGGGCGVERQLNVQDPDVEIITSVTTSSIPPPPYMDTRQFIIFAKEKVVLSIYFDNTVHPFPIDARFHVFDQNEALDLIEHWVSNQHSQNVYDDAAKPVREEPLPANKITITSETITGHTTAPLGSGWDHYRVVYSVKSYTIRGLLSLSAFNNEAMVYLYFPIVPPPLTP
ncbi:MAG: hypothetical protein M0036_23710 [Desulfobacteraceae bacterium]|nr:hypothetical protein [Desulfobacteraceae bacterium]